MAVSDYMQHTAKWKARIVTSDPEANYIEAVVGDGAIRYISVGSMGPTFRWPVEGETWTIYMENQSWSLGERWPDPEEWSPTSLSPGQVLIDGNEVFDSNGNRLAAYDPSEFDDGETLVWNADLGIFEAGIPPSVGGAAPELVVARASRNANTTVPALYSRIPFDVEETDSHGFYDIATRRFQPTLAGWYQVTVETVVGSVAAAQGTWTYIVKNSTGGNFPTTGQNVAYNGHYAATSESIANPVSTTVYMNGTTDFLEIWFWGWSPNSWTFYGTASNNPAYVAITSVGGPSGVDGRTILNGTGAPSNAVGINGDFYLRTDTTQLYGPKAANVWPGSGITLIGAQGIQGIQGIQGNTGPTGAAGLSVRNGTSAPTAGIGFDGDFYINTATWQIYGPKASGAWPAGVSLIGPQGIQGVQGIQGIPGTAGTNGQGVPTGGSTGQALVKVDATDYNTTWGSAGHTVMDEGVARAAEPNLDFQGAGVSVTDDAANSKTIVTIPGGGGGGGSALGGAQYNTTIGDGAARTFTVTHALGTRNVQVSVYQTASPYQDVTGGLEYEHTSVDQVIIRTSAALAPLALNEYTVVVSGPGAALTSQTIDSWHYVGTTGEPAFGTNWSSWSAFSGGVAFRKMPDGTVKLKGVVIATGAASSTLFTLPVGCRPSGPLIISVRYGEPSSAGRIDISAAGVVAVTNGSLTNGSWLSLDGVSFMAEDAPVTTLPAGPPGTSGNSWTAVIGDGTSKTFTLTHGMGTRSVNVACYQTASPYSEVEVEVERTSPNVVTIKTATALAAPTSGQYTVVITGPGAAVSSQTIEGWHIVGAAGEPAFQNSWTSYGGGYQVGAFRKDPLGKVQIRGLLTGGTAGTAVPGSGVAFTLPAGYRPVTRVTAAGSLGGTPAQRIDVMATGEVLMYSAGPGLPMGLDLIEFDTDTVTTLPAGPPGGQSYTQTFGDGTNRVFTVPHNLATWNVNVSVRETNAPRAEVPAEIEYTDQNTLTIRTSASLAAPTAGQYTVVVNGPGSAITQQTIDPWHNVGGTGEPAYNPPWATAGTGFGVQFRKTPDGKVTIRGIAQNTGGTYSYGTNTGRIFTLPAGYRPARNHNFDRILWDADSSIDLARVVIQTTGELYLFGPVVSAGASGLANTQMLLDDIEFDTETVTTLPAGPQGVPGGTSISTVIGDGATRTFTVDHNMATRNVNVQVFETNSPYSDVTSSVEFERNSLNQITIRANPALPAPSQNQYTVVVSGSGSTTPTDPIIVRGVKASNQTLANGSNGPVLFDEATDTHGFWNGTRFQPTRPGWYSLRCRASFASITAGQFVAIYLTKNDTAAANVTPVGGSILDGDGKYASGVYEVVEAQQISYFNGTTDYAEAKVSSPSATAVMRADTNPNGNATTFEVTSVGVPGPQGPPGPAGNLPAKVSTLPTVGLSDGLEVYYQSAAMATAGVRWHLVYNASSASTYKWEFVGGGNLHAELLAVGTSLTTTISAAFNAIVVPLTGDYDVSMSANLAASSQGNGAQGWLYINGVQITDRVFQMGSDATGGGLAILSSVGFTFRVTNTVAGVTFDNRYMVGAGAGTVGNRSMTITPVRVG